MKFTPPAKTSAYACKPGEDIDRLLDSANLHVLRTEGDYSRYMKLYEVLAMR